MVARRSIWRLALLLPAGICLLAGLDAALILAGLPAPVDRANLADVHGMVMVFGFLGALIALERAVALRHPLAYAAPVLSALGGIVLLMERHTLGTLLLCNGMVALTVVYVFLWRRNHDPVVLGELAGALLAACSAALWLVSPVAGILPGLVGFIVLTIASERVELARLAMPRNGGAILLVFTAAVAAGVALAWIAPAAVRVLGIILVLFVVWLLRHDVARRTVRAKELPRFSAVALLAGYAWLILAGVVWLVPGPVGNGSRGYDAVVHAVFLGFAMSMVLAHAPIILPAVLGRELPYRPVMYLPLALLQVGLVLRIFIGDGLDLTAPWQVGAALNVIALLLFVVVAAVSVALGAPKVRTAISPERMPTSP